MSTDIFEAGGVLATVFTGPVREGSHDRTMIQISDRSGQYVQLYPSALQGILTGWYEHTEREAAPSGEKFDLIAVYDLGLHCVLQARRVVRATDEIDEAVPDRMKTAVQVIFVLVTETSHLKSEDEIDLATATVLIHMQHAEQGRDP